MNIVVVTTRFGEIEIAGDRVVTFPKGMLGFSRFKRYTLLQPNDDSAWFWMQCIDEPSLAFVVTDPALYFHDYTAPISPEQTRELGLSRLDDAQVFVLVNSVHGKLTANLQGPIVINTVNRSALQLVLPGDGRWHTRHPLNAGVVRA